MRSIARHTLALLAAAQLLSCGTQPEDPVASDGGFQDLSQREDVITSIAQGYNRQNLSDITRALDEVFSFCYTVNFKTTCWGATEDLQITERLFSPAVIPPESEPITKVAISLVVPDGWVSSTPPDPNRYPGISFWEKTVEYVILVTRGGRTTAWRQNGRATFIIRGVTIDNRGQWRLFGIADHSGYWGELKAAFAESEG